MAVDLAVLQGHMHLQAAVKVMPVVGTPTRVNIPVIRSLLPTADLAVQAVSGYRKILTETILATLTVSVRRVARMAS
jgi:hypothetical protein